MHRVRYTTCDDAAALQAVCTLSRAEGIIPALESAHAVSAAIQRAAELSSDKIVLICLSGRGDKDCNEIADLLAKVAKPAGATAKEGR
jgi:tryptophan synthase beta subunit